MLEGKDHDFRFTKVMNMEINAKNSGPNVLVLGNPSCFQLFSWLLNSNVDLRVAHAKGGWDTRLYNVVEKNTKSQRDRNNKLKLLYTFIYLSQIMFPKKAQGLYHSTEEYLNVEVFEKHFNGWTLWIKISGKATFGTGPIISIKIRGSQSGRGQQSHLITRDRTGSWLTNHYK